MNDFDLELINLDYETGITKTADDIKSPMLLSGTSIQLQSIFSSTKAYDMAYNIIFTNSLPI